MHDDLTTLRRELLRQCHALQKRGFKPNMVLLGEKQADTVYSNADSLNGIRMNLYGLKIIWSFEDDKVLVIEKRPHGWLF